MLAQKLKKIYQGPDQIEAGNIYSILENLIDRLIDKIVL